MPETNPAYRLLVILHALRDLGGTQTTIGTAWASALGAPEGTREFTLAKAQFGQALVDVQAAIDSLEGYSNTTMYSRYVSRWGRFLASPPSNNSQAFNPDSVSTNEELDVLEALSNLLNARFPEIEPAPDVLVDLLEQVVGLIATVRDADDLDADLRIFLLKLLKDVEQALSIVRIRGVRGIDEVLGRVALELQRNSSVWERIAKWSGWTALLKLLNGLDKAATGVEKLSRLEAGFSDALGEIEPPS